VLFDVIDATPAMAENRRSSGEAIENAMVSALAFGYSTATVTVRTSSATAGWWKAAPMATMDAITSVVVTGRRLQISERRIGLHS
jgi:hypothetical protein